MAQPREQAGMRSRAAARRRPWERERCGRAWLTALASALLCAGSAAGARASPQGCLDVLALAC